MRGEDNSSTEGVEGNVMVLRLADYNFRTNDLGNMRAPGTPGSQ
jgi:hypothetical protein